MYQMKGHKPYSVKVTVWFKYKNGYLLGNDVPLLPFFAIMRALYCIYALYWLGSCVCYLRHLLKVQIWIGGVILLGLIEKAVFFAEYKQIENTGEYSYITLISGELISCMSRTFMRMLLILASLGFDIVKSLSVLKVLAVGALYFVLSLVNSLFRAKITIMALKDRDKGSDIMAALTVILLVCIIDVVIFCWVMSNLRPTMRTLREHDNISKLKQYRYFTFTLVFCAIATVVFKVWFIARYSLMQCWTYRNDRWLDEVAWHIISSFILLVIIVLWRPSKNSQ